MITYFNKRNLEKPSWPCASALASFFKHFSGQCAILPIRVIGFLMTHGNVRMNA